MKILIKLVLLASFALIVFFPATRTYNLLYWGLFVVMFILVILYFFASYWVSNKDIEEETGKPVGFSLFCGKLPLIQEDDQIRGRLVIDSEHLTLYKRLEGKERTKEHHCKEIWSIPVSEIASIGTGPVITIRKGLILYLEDGGEVRFICKKALKCKDQIIAAMGWSEAPEVSPGFGATVDVEGHAPTAKSFSDALKHGVDEEPEEVVVAEPEPKKKRRSKKI